MSGPIFRYDFTFFETEKREELTRWLDVVAADWVFQLERGEDSKRDHFQGYMSLKEKTRKTTLINTLKGTGLETLHVNPAHDGNAVMKYASKDATRVAGPWCSESIRPKIACKRKRDEITDEEIAEALRARYEGATLRPWQDAVNRILMTPDERTVHWVYDPTGAIGKTWFARWARHNHGTMCITAGKAADLLYLVSKFKCRAYIIDLARTITTPMEEIYQAIESVKNGYFISTKYETCIVEMDYPSVVVFSNRMPKIDALSTDRWRIWSILENQLVPWGGARAVTPAPGEV